MLPRLVFALTALLLLAGCSAGHAARAGGPIRVVASENFWGSIAAQLGGTKVAVKSIIVNPATDPHSYEPTAGDARTMAGAKLAIVNGIGYDKWASQLIAANPVSGRSVLDVGDVLGLKDGDNPHQWYSPASVTRFVDAIVRDYRTLDPKDAAYFTARKQRFETVSLARYDALRSEIRQRFAGTPVGYSESIFEPLGASLGLKLLTPYSFAKAVAEGADVSAKDEATVTTQAERREIRVWVYNSQNATPDVQGINAIARAHGIPIATVTETLSPASDTFEQWQVAQLEELLTALERGDGALMAAVELVDAAAAIGGRTIWSDASLRIEPGEFVAILGPNGAGKSTLLQVLLGLLPVAVGSVSVLGGPPGAQNRAIGYLPQRHAFDASTRVRGVDLVRLGLDGARWGIPLPGRDPHAGRVAETIRLVGAEGYAERAIGELSGGEQQRLLIAQALVGGPQLLFLDEPLDSLDLPNQLAVAGLLDDICRSRNMTILLVAHDVNPLLAHLDRVVYVAGGRVLAGPPEEVITTETLTELYQAPVEVLRTSDGRLVVVGQPDVHSHHGHAH